MSRATLMRAGSEPLRPRVGGGYGLVAMTEQEMRTGSYRGPEKPDPVTVIRQGMSTNPYVRSVVEGPALIAGMIPLYPVFGLRTGRPRRASPDGTDQEKMAIKVWRRYVDDCGSQQSLIARHFAAKRSTGELAQIRYRRDQADSPKVYEVVQNSPQVLEQNRDGSWTWHRRRWQDPEDRVRIEKGDARRVWTKGFMHTAEPSSTLLPLADLIAAWELTMRALTYGVKTDILLSGLIVGPKDPTAEHDWTDRWFEWITLMAQDGQMRIPFPLSVPPGLGDQFKLIEPGQTIQKGLLELEKLLSKGLARYSGIDPQLVLEGSGSASHWNGILMKRDNLQSFIWPTTQQLVLADIIAWPFRPALAATGMGFDVEDWGIDGDWQQIAVQPDQLDKVIGMADKGWIPEAVPMAMIGLEESEIMQPGSEQWERWESRHQVKANSPEESVPPSREPVGVGGETFADPPQPGSDTSAMPNPTPRAATAVLDRPDAWDQRYGEAFDLFDSW